MAATYRLPKGCDEIVETMRTVRRPVTTAWLADVLGRDPADTAKAMRLLKARDVVVVATKTKPRLWKLKRLGTGFYSDFPARINTLTEGKTVSKKSEEAAEGDYVTVKRKTGEENILFFQKVPTSGRPRKVLTDVGAAFVTEQIANGLTIEQVISIFGISTGTLYAAHNRSLFERAVQKGYAMRDANLSKKQIQVAMAGNPTMLIFLGKQYLGQSDNPPPAAVPVSPIPDFVRELMEDVEL